MAARIVKPARAARFLVTTSVAVGAGYLLWRVGWTGDGAARWLFWPLWFAELTMLIELVAMARQLWTLRTEDRADDSGSPVTEPPSVDVVVICRNEPVAVLRATLIACARIRGARRTVALDTVGRAELAELTALAGAEHLVASTPDAMAPEAHLNVVLGHLAGDLIAVLHGDDIPLPGLISELAGDFEDPRTWMAQGARSLCGSTDPVEHSAGDLPRRCFRSNLDASVGRAAMNHHGAAIWCGSGALVRRSALLHLGGVPTSTETPAFQLSLRASRHGWRSTFHSEPVVLALAEPDPAIRATEHTRRSAGKLRAVTSSDSPLWASGFTLAQRLAYLSTVGTSITAIRRVTVLAVLAGTVLFGELPMATDPVLVVSAWGLWMGLGVLAKRLLTRSEGEELVHLRDRWMLMGPQCRGLLASLRAPRPRLEHPPRIDRAPGVTPALRLFTLGAAALALGLGYQVLSAAGGPGPPPLPAAALALAAIGATGLLCIYGAAVTEFHRADRGEHQRLLVRAAADLGGHSVPLLDLRDDGAEVALLEAPPRGRRYLLRLMLPGLDGTLHPVTVAVAVSNVRPDPTAQLGNLVDLRLTHLSDVARSRLLECCQVVLPARVAALRPDHSHRGAPLVDTYYVRPWTMGGSIRPVLANAAQAATVSFESSGRSPGGNHRTSRISAEHGSTRSADAS